MHESAPLEVFHRLLPTLILLKIFTRVALNLTSSSLRCARAARAAQFFGRMRRRTAALGRALTLVLFVASIAHAATNVPKLACDARLVPPTALLLFYCNLVAFFSQTKLAVIVSALAGLWLVKSGSPLLAVASLHTLCEVYGSSLSAPLAVYAVGLASALRCKDDALPPAVVCGSALVILTPRVLSRVFCRHKKL